MTTKLKIEQKLWGVANQWFTYFILAEEALADGNKVAAKLLSKRAQGYAEFLAHMIVTGYESQEMN